MTVQLHKDSTLSGKSHTFLSMLNTNPIPQVLIYSTPLLHCINFWQSEGCKWYSFGLGELHGFSSHKSAFWKIIRNILSLM